MSSIFDSITVIESCSNPPMPPFLKRGVDGVVSPIMIRKRFGESVKSFEPAPYPIALVFMLGIVLLDFAIVVIIPTPVGVASSNLISDE